jgi:phenylacetate-CoA ligase
MLDNTDEKLSAYRPDFLRCYTSALTLHANRLRFRGKRPAYPRLGIITGGEKLDATQRRIISDVFSVPVYETYGSRDCALMAMQLSAFDHRLHIPGANIMLEPHGDDDPGSGSEILVTDLHRRGMPFLRYRIGDRARFSSNQADSPAEFLEEVTGRTVDLVYLKDGRVIHGIQFPRLFRDFDVCEFQVVQQTNGDIEVLLVPGPALADRDKEKIERVLRSILNGNALSISLVSSITRTPGGKLRPVTSSYLPAAAADRIMKHEFSSVGFRGEL